MPRDKDRGDFATSPVKSIRKLGIDEIYIVLKRVSEFLVEFRPRIRIIIQPGIINYSKGQRHPGFIKQIFNISNTRRCA